MAGETQRPTSMKPQAGDLSKRKPAGVNIKADA